jgi:CheY-like chemotaxis protein
MGEMAGVKQMAFSHHDPGRTDDALDELVQAARSDLKARGSTMEVFAAADGQLIELDASSDAKSGDSSARFSAVGASKVAVKDLSVLIGVSDDKLAGILTEAAEAEGVETTRVKDAATVLAMAKAAPPTLIFLEDQPAGMDGLSVCKSLRAESDPRLKEVPIVIVADRERTSEGIAAGVTRWLIAPFSSQYARTQIQAWLVRSSCRWARADLPVDEDQRLAALRELSILDTPPEERFDRITRITAALGDVPIALVTLVDKDRQWFKSCIGINAAETPREPSFCAHVVVSRKPMIVGDTLQDDRFADNPFVTSGPRIRFYAGFPIFHSNGRCLGSLCLIDIRPRHYPETTMRRFEDLARLVEEEINANPRPTAA